MIIDQVNKSDGKVTSVEATPNLDNKDFKKTLKVTWLAKIEANQPSVAKESSPGKETSNAGDQLNDEITAQGLKVRELKSNKAEKAEVTAAVAVLLDLKAKYKAAVGKDWKPDSHQPSKAKEPSPSKETTSNADDQAKAAWTPTVCVYYDHIINKAVLEKTDDFKEFVDKNTETSIEMLGDPELKSLRKGDIIQIQRRGFFIVDQAYAPPSPNICKPTAVRLVFDLVLFSFVPQFLKSLKPNYFKNQNSFYFPILVWVLFNQRIAVLQ